MAYAWVSSYHRAGSTSAVVSAAATPVATPGGGTYTTTQNVVLSSSTPGATIYYTVDTTNPTISGPQYTVPIVISSLTLLQAIAVAPGYSPSSALIANYNVTIPLVFTPTPLPDAFDGVPYSQLVTFSNGTGPFTLLAGPSWMTITQQNSSTSCTVGGTPTGSGTVTVTFRSTV